MYDVETLTLHFEPTLSGRQLGGFLLTVWQEAEAPVMSSSRSREAGRTRPFNSPRKEKDQSTASADCHRDSSLDKPHNCESPYNHRVLDRRDTRR